VVMSLQETNFITTRFVGVANYMATLTDPAFYLVIMNSIIYMIILVPLNIGLSCWISTMLFWMNKRWRDTSRIILYMPVLCAGVIIAQSWKWIFHADGPINWLLGLFGISKIFWFAQGSTAIPIISLIVALTTIGSNVIILLASMETIDSGIIDASRIDGASRSQINRYIILPMVSPTIALIGMISAISAFQIIETPMMLAPQEYAATLTYSIYRQGFLFSKYGIASAQAVILLVIISIASVIKSRLKNE